MNTQRLEAASETSEFAGGIGLACHFIPPAVQSQAAVIGRNSMVLFQPIALNNESIGTIFIEADLKDLSGWLTRFLEIDFLVSLASLAVAFLLSTRLQRVISGPIQELANTTSSVSSRRTARVKREGIVVSIVDVLLCALAAKRKWAIFTRDPDPTNYAKVLPISIHGINRSCFVS